MANHALSLNRELINRYRKPPFGAIKSTSSSSDLSWQMPVIRLQQRGKL